MDIAQKHFEAALLRMDKLTRRTIEDAKNRGTGLTTRQMQDAPHGALFLWCNGDTRHARDLAHSLGRLDLVISDIYQLTPAGIRRFGGVQFPAVVIDHASNLDRHMLASLQSLIVGCIRPTRQDADISA